jgi:hypothetical protein
MATLCSNLWSQSVNDRTPERSCKYIIARFDIWCEFVHHERSKTVSRADSVCEMTLKPQLTVCPRSLNDRYSTKIWIHIAFLSITQRTYNHTEFQFSYRDINPWIRERPRHWDRRDDWLCPVVETWFLKTDWSSILVTWKVWTRRLVRETGISWEAMKMREILVL